MKLDELIPHLSKTELFGHLDEDSLRQLAAKGIRRRHKKGELIFRQGDEGRSVYVLLEGLVKIFLTSERGDEMLLVTLQVRATFGELALVDGLPHRLRSKRSSPSKRCISASPISSSSRAPTLCSAPGSSNRWPAS